MEKEKELEILNDWLTEQLKNGSPPRMSDIVDYCYRVLKFKKLKQIDIKKIVRLHPAYLMNSRQQRPLHFSGKYRPIITNHLGSLHADIAFFSLTREYSTPKMYQSGILVAKDVLSRMTYVAILRFTRTADSIINAFSEIFKKFEQHNPGLQVKSIAFDQEKSVLSNKVQSFFKSNNVAFHVFQNTASKSKFAEGSIRLIRETIQRLKFNSEKRWWNLIQPAVDILNSQPIRIKGKYIKSSTGEYFTPANVTKDTLDEFLSKLHKNVPMYYFSQFAISPRFARYKFKIGNFVRQKLIASSSKVIGEKRSEKTLGDDVFIITALDAYISTKYTIEPLYKCQSIYTNKIETFDEWEIVETPNPK